MNYCTFFSMAAGLSGTIIVPKGLLANCQQHVAWTEERLGLTQEKYGDNPPHWKSTDPKESVSDEVLCETASTHNDWIRWLYGKLAEWQSKPPTEWTVFAGRGVELSAPWADTMSQVVWVPISKTEKLTCEKAQTFWHGLQKIEVKAERWTADYYRGRMNHLYEVMRGRENEG